MANYKDISEEPLTEAERRMAHRILSDPLGFPPRFTVWLDNRYLRDETADTGGGEAPCSNPVNTVLPDMFPDGNPGEGEAAFWHDTITTTTGTWTSADLPVFTYEWQDSNVEDPDDADWGVMNHTSNTDTDTVETYDQVGYVVKSFFRVKVTATNACGSTTVYAIPGRFSTD